MKHIYLVALISLFCYSTTALQAQSCPLACNNNIEIALGPNCSHTVMPDDILENPGLGCPYVVTVYDPQGNPIGNTINGDYIGHTLEVRVQVNGNMCWGTIDVEDRWAPTINCQPTITALCGDPNAGGIPSNLVSDNCDPDPDIIILQDNYQDLPCSHQYTAIRTVTYQAVDQAGNHSAPCTQTIQYERANLSDVDFPLNRDGHQLPAFQCNDPSWDKNNNGYPDPSEAGVPTVAGNPIYPNGAFCDLGATFDDNQIPLCGGGYTVIRKWTVYDWCSSTSTTHTQIIKVMDNSTPTISCPNDITVHGGYDCDASVQLPSPYLGGNCTGSFNYNVTVSSGYVEFINGYYVVYGLPTGTHTATYTASNPCGGTPVSCTIKITVTGGGNGPIPVCDQNTVVALGSDGTGRVYASTFNDGSYANCGDIAYIKVRRMTEGWCPPGVDDDTEFRDYVEFCCEDVTSSPIQVVLRVYDNQGNFNECMVWVYVQSKLSPKLYCPPDITIDCDYPLDIWDLSEFGTVVDDKSQRKPIYVNGVKVGYDGYVTGGGCNGGYTVKEDILDHRKCEGGFIKRVFTIYNNGYHVSCYQKIFVKSGKSFSCSNIKWPKDVTLNACSPVMTGPDHTGRPEVYGLGCGSLIATNYKDEVFPVVDGFCYKILRTWKVLDWCTYDPNNKYKGSGICEYTQVIKILDTDKPEFVDGCKDIEVCATDVKDCKGLVNISPWIEDCTPDKYLEYTYRIDIFNDNAGSYPRWDISKNSKNLHEYLPFGTHKVFWKVRDRCGNEGTCIYLLTVKDCKEPTPYCLHGLVTVVMPVNGMIEVPARQFDTGSFDNCTKNKDLIFSYSSDVNEKTRIFTCAEEGRNEVEIWVTDQAGNQDYCLTYIDIQDNRGTCPDTTSIIAGNITTPKGNGIPQAAVYFDHAQLLDGTHSMTDMAGDYSLERLELMQGDSFMVEPISDWEPRLGVTAFDLYLLQLHILQLAPFTYAHQFIAADINNDERINFNDFLALKQIVLRNTDEFPNNNSWRFIDKGHVFNSMDEVFPFPEMKYANVPSDYAKRVDFTGIKVGDIDFTGVPQGSNLREANFITIELQDKIMDPLKGSVQFKLPEEFAYSALEIEVLDENWTLNDLRTDAFEQIYVSDLNAVGLNKSGLKMEGTNFELELELKGKGLKLSEVMNSEKLTVRLYDENGKTYKLAFRFNGDSDREMSFNVYPNPFSSMVQLDLTVDESSEYTLKVHDMLGKEVFEAVQDLDKGANSLRLDLANLPVSGLYTISVMKGEQRLWTKRLVRE